MNSIALIREAHTKKEYRPVVVAVIKNINGHIIVVQSAKNKHEWYLPQGGIDQD
jgi:8-oxo-dGTP pyrophosphatase MutT (NUDIX family)